MADIKLNSIEDAVKDFQKGKFVIVVDDEDRENEGDLIIAAEKIRRGEGKLHAQECKRCALCPHHPEPMRGTRLASPGIRQHIHARHPIHSYRGQAGGLLNRSISPRPRRDHQGSC